MRKTVDNLLKALLWVCGGIAVAFLALILIYVITRGIPYINWEFLTTAYRPGLGSNGIRDIIVGTLAMVGLTLVIAVPIGVLAAIYMGEYAKKGKVLTTIRFCVESLAGIPSILYGLFGYTFFAIQLAFGFSLLSSALTLAIMVLPVIIRSTEEALFTRPGQLPRREPGAGGEQADDALPRHPAQRHPGHPLGDHPFDGPRHGRDGGGLLHGGHHGARALERVLLNPISGGAPVFVG